MLFIPFYQDNILTKFQEELNITKKLLVVVLSESDWSGDLKMMKYYNITLQPHLTEVTFLDKPPSGKTDILDVLKHVVSGQTWQT